MYISKHSALEVKLLISFYALFPLYGKDDKNFCIQMGKYETNIIFFVYSDMLNQRDFSDSAFCVCDAVGIQFEYKFFKA